MFTLTDDKFVTVGTGFRFRADTTVKEAHVEEEDGLTASSRIVPSFLKRDHCADMKWRGGELGGSPVRNSMYFFFYNKYSIQFISYSSISQITNLPQGFKVRTGLNNVLTVVITIIIGASTVGSNENKLVTLQRLHSFM